jgi:acetyl-CoA carboxylase biotin carboxyl carrier protein
MTIEEIREFIKVATETGIAELEVQRGEDRVRIVRSAGGSMMQHVVVPAVTSSMAAPAPHSEAPGATLDPSLVAVKSPIVGTFYEAGSPGVPPFVQVGDTVQVGQVLCIIESMKLMNEIESEVAGVVVSKLVANAQPVEYGEALFAIRPA